MNPYHSAGWWVWHTYNYSFPGVKPVSIKRFIVHMRGERETRAARKIQRAWRRCVSDPSYKVCKTRLEREFREF